MCSTEAAAAAESQRATSPTTTKNVGAKYLSRRRHRRNDELARTGVGGDGETEVYTGLKRLLLYQGCVQYDKSRIFTSF